MFQFFVGDLCDLIISVLLFVMLCVSLPPSVFGMLMLTVFWVSLLIVGDSPDPYLPSGICHFLAPFSQGYAGVAAEMLKLMKLSDGSAAFDDDGFLLTDETPIFHKGTPETLSKICFHPFSEKLSDFGKYFSTFQVLTCVGAMAGPYTILYLPPLWDAATILLVVLLALCFLHTPHSLFDGITSLARQHEPRDVPRGNQLFGGAIGSCRPPDQHIQDQGRDLCSGEDQDPAFK